MHFMHHFAGLSMYLIIIVLNASNKNVIKKPTFSFNCLTPMWPLNNVTVNEIGTNSRSWCQWCSHHVGFTLIITQTHTWQSVFMWLKTTYGWSESANTCKNTPHNKLFHPSWWKTIVTLSQHQIKHSLLCHCSKTQGHFDSALGYTHSNAKAIHQHHLISLAQWQFSLSIIVKINAHCESAIVCLCTHARTHTHTHTHITVQFLRHITE